MSSNLANRVAASMRRLLCKSGLQAFKAGGNNGCLAADSKPEVIGHAEKLTRHDVSLIALVQHIHEPLRKLRLSQDPTTTQTAESVRFCEAARDDEFRAVAKRGLKLLVHAFQVDFVDQHARANASRDFAVATQDRVSRKNAARIVKVRENDQLRPRSNHLFGSRNLKTRFDAASE